MKYKYILKGVVKSIPGVEYLYNFHKHTGGDTENARYCYSIWLRHLVLAYKNGLEKMPETVMELGPGHSIGVGIAALLSGVKKYYGFEIVKYSNATINLRVLEVLAELFKNKTPIPDNNEFPMRVPELDDYSFPEYIISDNVINRIKQGDIINEIREAIQDIDYNKPNKLIMYAAPWYDINIDRNSVDMILSQGVLQSEDQIEDAYKKMSLWLKQNGMLSHTIDFKSLMSSDEWYGHWAYSDLEWKIVRGRKSFYTNRLSLSNHLQLLEKYNFRLIDIYKKKEKDIISRNKLAKRFNKFTDEDLSTSITFFQAVKKGS